MKPCRWAGLPCRDEATATVRIAGVGDRSVCDFHLATLERLGMDFRRLDEQGAFVPEWRRHLTAVDRTGALGR
jgi:hypothetical protein